VNWLATVGKRFFFKSGNCQEGLWRQGLEENIDISNYQKVEEGKPAAVAADLRILYAKASITNIAAKVENDW
jgi:hypothetical protein